MNIIRSVIAGRAFGLQGVRSASLLLLFLPFSLAAQSGAGPSSALGVEIGDSFEYEGLSRTEAEVQLPFADSVQKVVKETGSLTMMEVSDITGDEIIWDLTMVVNIGDGEGGAGQPMPVMMTMTTDHQGKLKNMSMGGDMEGMPGGELMSMITSGSSRSTQGPGWFTPEGLLERKVGESWELETRDTASTSLLGSLTLDVITSATTVYTYEGTVDTLGVQAAKVRWVIKKLKMEGGMDVDIPDAEFSMSMKGKGEGKGIAYYSLKGMLLAQNMDMTMDQEMDIQAAESMAVKMKIRIYTEQSLLD